jgi:hypothetical protein
MDHSAIMMYAVHPIGAIVGCYRRPRERKRKQAGDNNSRLGHVLLPVVSRSENAAKQQRVPILFPKR